MSIFTKPILLIAYNRPQETKKVLNRIKEIHPQYLYIAVDGPKSDFIDKKKWKEVKFVIEETLNWECKVKFLYQKRNLGCKIAVSKAISWFFDHVEEGIILEDDCLPVLSFFYFCENLLETYREDTRIMLISGTNFQKGKERGLGSYYFSKYSAIWGWATWKRVWKKYDVNISSFADFKKQNQIKSIFNGLVEQFFWNHVFTNVHKGLRDTWDHQLAYTIMSNNGLSIVPGKNLVTNIGFTSDSTRTKDAKHALANMKSEQINNLIHPKFVLANTCADKYMFNTIYMPMIIKQGVDTLKHNLISYVKNIFNK